MPEYGIRIESTPSSAVPLNAISQPVSPGADAVPVACQLIVLAEVFSVPCAVPETWRSPAQVALNEPRAAVAVCSVAFHLKFVHELGDGMMFAEDQLPSMAFTPVAEGPTSPLFRSNPTHAEAEAAANDNATINVRFFMVSSL